MEDNRYYKEVFCKDIIFIDGKHLKELLSDSLYSEWVHKTHTREVLYSVEKYIDVLVLSVNFLCYSIAYFKMRKSLGFERVSSMFLLFILCIIVISIEKYLKKIVFPNYLDNLFSYQFVGDVNEQL